MKETQKKFMKAYGSYADSMFRHCYIRVSNREEARDLIQDAFMRTWDYVHKGNKIENWKAFLFMTLNNLIIDWYRKKKPLPLENEIAIGIPDEYHSKDPQLEAEGKLAMELLEKLDDKTKTVITLRLVEGWSPKEIARLFGETENTVSVRIHRGINSLQNLVTNKNQ